MFNDIFTVVHNRLYKCNDTLDIDGSELTLSSDNIMSKHTIRIIRCDEEYCYKNIFNIFFTNDTTCASYCLIVDREKVAQLATFFSTLRDFIDDSNSPLYKG